MVSSSNHEVRSRRERTEGRIARERGRGIGCGRQGESAMIFILATLYFVLVVGLLDRGAGWPAAR